MEDTEAQMRRALGLYGDAPRHRNEPDRAEAPQRSMDRYVPGGHRRRFVQDGDVPVTVVRRDGNPDAPTSRPTAPVPPSQSRLQRTEAALAAETAARDRAERALAEAQAIVRDLQTKIGHADLAKNEALEAAGRDREALATLRAAVEDHERQSAEAAARVRAAEEAREAAETELFEERNARLTAERALRDAIAARESTELLLRELSESPAHAPVALAPMAHARVAPAPVPPRAKSRLPNKPQVEPVVPRGRTKPIAPKSIAPRPEVEPEPVKWWLMSKPASKRR